MLPQAASEGAPVPQRPQPLSALSHRRAAAAAAASQQWIAKQQLARQRTKCFWREPVGQQKSDSGIEAEIGLFAESRLAPRTID
eukprot:SAG25_NODE_4_length_30349_cov_110.018280_4_plen_84_part_00